MKGLAENVPNKSQVSLHVAAVRCKVFYILSSSDTYSLNIIKNKLKNIFKKKRILYPVRNIEIIKQF